MSETRRRDAEFPALAMKCLVFESGQWSTNRADTGLMPRVYLDSIPVEHTVQYWADMNHRIIQVFPSEQDHGVISGGGAVNVFRPQSPHLHREVSVRC